MATLAKLVVELVGDIGGFVGDMDKAESKMSKFGSGMMKAGAGMTAGITTPIVGMGVAILAVGGQFDEAMDTIRTTTGATGSELTGLGDDVKAVFSKIPTDMATAAQAISELNARTGQTGKGLQDLGAAEIELARITGGDLGSQIQNTTRMFGDWGVAVTDQVPALDTLMRAHQETGIGVDTLASKLVQFGAPLRQMGFDFQTSAALIGKFEKEGVNTELVLGSLRIALGKMAKAGIEPKEGLKQLVDSIQKAGSTADANKLAIAAFGARAGPDMAAAIREGRFSVEELYDTIANGKDTVMGAAADTNDYAEKFTILKNQAMTAAIPLGVTLFDAINKLMPTFEKVIGFVSRLITGFSNLPSGVQTGIMAFVALVAALGPVIGIVGTIMTVVGAIGPVVAAVGAVIMAALGPVLLIVAAVALVAGALYLAWKTNFLGIRDILAALGAAISAVFEFVKGIISKFIAFLSGDISWDQFARYAEAAFKGLQYKLSAIWESIKETVATAWETIKGVFSQALAALGTILLNGIANFIAPIVGGMDNAKRIVTEAWENIKTFLAGVWEAIKTSATAAWEALKGIIKTAIEVVRTVIAVVLAGISGDWGTAWETLKSGIGRVFGEIKTTIGTVAETIRSGLAAKWEAMRAGAVEKWEAMRAGAVEKFEAIKTAAAEKFEAIRAGAAEKWEAVWTAISGVVGRIRDFVVGVLGELVTKAAELFGKIIAAISGNGGPTAEGGGGLGSLLNVTTLQTTIAQVITLIRGLQTSIATIWTEIQTNTTLVWTTIQTTLTTITATLLVTYTTWLAAMLLATQVNNAALLLDTQTIWAAIALFLTTTTATVLVTYTTWLAAVLLATKLNNAALLLDTQTIWTAIALFLTTTTATLLVTYTTWLAAVLLATKLNNAALLLDTQMTWKAIQLFMFTYTTRILNETLDNYKKILGGYRALGQLLMLEVKTTWGIISLTVITAAQQMRAGAVAEVQVMHDQIMAILNGMEGEAYAAGAALARAFGNGIRSELESALADARRLAAEIRALLPGSDAKTGPLSDLTASGKALPITFGKGIAAGTGVAVSAATNMVLAVGSALDGLGANAWGDGGTVPPSIEDLGSFIQRLIEAIKRAADLAGGDLTDVVKAFMESAGKALDLIWKALTLVRDMADLSLSNPIAPERLAQYLAWLVGSIAQAISQAASLMSTDAITAAADFGEKAGKTLDVVGKAVQLVKDMADLSLSNPMAPERLAEYLAWLVGSIARAISQAAQLIAADAMTAAADFAEKAGKTLEVVIKAVEVVQKMADLKTYPNFDAAALGTYLANLIGILTQAIAKAALSIGSDLATAAADFAEKAGKVLAVVGASVEAVNALAEFTMPPVEGLTILWQNLVAFALSAAQSMATAAGLLGSAGEDAVKFSGQVKAVFEALGSAITFAEQLAAKALPANLTLLLEAVLQFARDIVTALASGITLTGMALAAQVTTAAAAIITAYATGLQQIQPVLDALQVLVDTVSATLNTLIDAAYNAGVAMGNSLAQGISDSTAAAVAAAGAMAAAVSAAATTAAPTSTAETVNAAVAAPGPTVTGGSVTGAQTTQNNQTINVTINNPQGQAAESDILRQLRNLAYVGVLAPA